MFSAIASLCSLAGVIAIIAAVPALRRARHGDAGDMRQGLRRLGVGAALLLAASVLAGLALFLKIALVLALGGGVAWLMGGVPRCLRK